MAINWTLIGAQTNLHKFPRQWLGIGTTGGVESLFKLSFDTSDWVVWRKYIRGWAYIKLIIYTSNETLDSKPNRIWLDETDTIFNLKNPEGLNSSKILSRDVQMMFLPNRRYPPLNSVSSTFVLFSQT